MILFFYYLFFFVAEHDEAGFFDPAFAALGLFFVFVSKAGVLDEFEEFGFHVRTEDMNKDDQVFKPLRFI